MHPHDDEDVLEVRADGLGGEGVSPRLLEHDGHDVVPDVAFPQQLVRTRQRRQITSNFIYTALFTQKMQRKVLYMLKHFQTQTYAHTHTLKIS